MVALRPRAMRNERRAASTPTPPEDGEIDVENVQQGRLNHLIALVLKSDHRWRLGRDREGSD